MKVIESTVVPPRKHRSDISRDAEIVCLKCLAKLPENRYSNAHELVADLDRLINEQPIHARSWNALERVQSLIRENIALVSVAAALIATLPVFFLMQPRETVPENDDLKHSSAISHLSSLIETNPLYAVPWLRRAEHRYSMGAFDSAREDAIKAGALGYSQPQHSHLLLGKCALKLQDYVTAEVEFANTVRLDAECSEAWIGLGHARVKNGQPRKAIEDLTRAIDLQPDNRMAYELRAAAFEITGATEAADFDRSVATRLMSTSDSSN